MKGTELRPGNYVLDLPSNEHKIVYGVSHVEGFDVAYVHYENEFDQPATFLIQPILLTMDWLEKFGFTGTDLGNYTIELSNGNFFILFCLEPIANDIFYVHQLQNLYYALTGKELVLTP